MTPDRDINLGPLELPAFLERVDGDIRIAGHRVSLFRVLDELRSGTSLDRLREMFPTVPKWKLEAVVSFCERHGDIMRRYHAAYRAAFDAGVGRQIGEGPSFAELRRRKAENTRGFCRGAFCARAQNAPSSSCERHDPA